MKLNRRHSEDQVPLVEGLSEVMSFKLDLNDCAHEALRMSSGRLFQTRGAEFRKAHAPILALDGITESFRVSAEERWTRGGDADSRVQITWFARLKDF